MIETIVRSICIHENKLLVQRDKRVPNNFYAFIGGHLLFGENMADCLKREFWEEIREPVEVLSYLFMVENHFEHNNRQHHTMEHFFEVQLRNHQIRSNEAHLEQEWINLDELYRYDVRPAPVKDVLINNSYREIKLLTVRNK